MSLYSESTNTHSKVHIRIVNILFLVAVMQNFKQSYFNVKRQSIDCFIHDNYIISVVVAFNFYSRNGC